MENRAVVVTGLSEQMTNDELATLFKQAGQIEKSAIVLGPGHKATGKAYVVYTAADSAQAAIQTLTDETVKVKAISSTDRAEFQALFPDESAEVTLLKALQALSPAQLADILGKLNPVQPSTLAQPIKKETSTDSIGAAVEDYSLPKPLSLGIKTEPGMDLPPSTSARSHDSGASPYGNAPVLLHEEPKLPYFSGSGKECTFGRWKYEVSCLADQNYSASTVATAVRRSLRSPAADVLTHLGIRATTDDILRKLTSIYGSVQSGDTLLERFYSEPQRPKESCAQWSCRLEDLIYQAAAKGAIDRPAVPQQLKKRFWSGLKDKRIKDALRHDVDVMSFEELLSEARVLEEEYSPTEEKSDARLHQVTDSDDKMDQLFKQLAKMQTQLDQLQKQQGQQKQQPKQTSKSESSGCDKKVVICEKCEQGGHLAFGCRRGKNVTCYKCNSEGHIAKACRNPRSALNTQ